MSMYLRGQESSQQLNLIKVKIEIKQMIKSPPKKKA